MDFLSRRTTVSVTSAFHYVGHRTSTSPLLCLCGSISVFLVLFTIAVFVVTQIFIYMPRGSFGDGMGDTYMALFASLYKMGISM